MDRLLWFLAREPYSHLVQSVGVIRREKIVPMGGELRRVEQQTVRVYLRDWAGPTVFRVMGMLLTVGGRWEVDFCEGEKVFVCREGL